VRLKAGVIGNFIGHLITGETTTFRSLFWIIYRTGCVKQNSAFPVRSALCYISSPQVKVRISQPVSRASAPYSPVVFTSILPLFEGRKSKARVSRSCTANCVGVGAGHCCCTAAG
jgi:hypothetical protein